MTCCNHICQQTTNIRPYKKCMIIMIMPQCQHSYRTLMNTSLNHPYANPKWMLNNIGSLPLKSMCETFIFSIPLTELKKDCQCKYQISAFKFVFCFIYFNTKMNKWTNYYHLIQQQTQIHSHIFILFILRSSYNTKLK